MTHPVDTAERVGGENSSDGLLRLRRQRGRQTDVVSRQAGGDDGHRRG